LKPTPKLAPNAPALLPSPDRIVVASTPRPTVASSSRLRSRALIGLGRLLRGTCQAAFIAFCPAWATPSPPYTAPSRPITSPAPLPRSPFGSPSWLPITGNWPSVEFSTRCCRCASPPRTNPSTLVNSSSSGNSDRKP